jgi:hypothetical protein
MGDGLVAAALCAGPPLLVPELSGADEAAAVLREASRAAVGAVVATAPDVVAVIGPAACTAEWPPLVRLDLAAYGAPDRLSSTPVAPLSVALGARLLDDVGYAGPRSLRSVDDHATLSTCRAIAADVVGAAARIGLVVMADGSARRSLKAPGYFDERAEPYDDRVRRIVASGELTELHTLDPALARELMAPGWPALQVLAAAFGTGRPQTTIHYDAAPYGVGYLVASLIS